MQSPVHQGKQSQLKNNNTSKLGPARCITCRLHRVTTIAAWKTIQGLLQHFQEPFSSVFKDLLKTFLGLQGTFKQSVMHLITDPSNWRCTVSRKWVVDRGVQLHRQVPPTSPVGHRDQHYVWACENSLSKTKMTTQCIMYATFTF